MPAARRDPYETLGVGAGASDAELRAAYRRLVQLHHPDHNKGSAESTRRFEEVQDAYARIRELRATGRAASRQPPPAHGPSRPTEQSPSAQAPPKVTVDPEVESRLAEIERELREARQARERARARAAREAQQAREQAARARAAREAQQAREQAAREAREAAERSETRRPSEEELGYIKTDDSFTKIFSDALAGLSDRASEARKTPAGERVGDLIEELDELASKLTGKRPHRDR